MKQPLSGDTYTTTAKYVWEGNTHSASSGQAYYDPLLFALEGGAWKHPMYDGLGSTRQLLDNTTQNVTDEYAYEAFGNLMDSTGSTPNPYRYVGSLGYYGTGSSLMHLGARYYLPEVGRFLTQDPVRGSRFDPQSLHRYSYVGNSPPSYVDPSGLSRKTCRAKCWAIYIACLPFDLCGYECEAAKDFCLADCDRKWTPPDWLPICADSRDCYDCCEDLGNACRVNDYYPDRVCNIAEIECKGGCPP